MIVALIPAAGTGSRLGQAGPKQYATIAGRPMIAYAVEALARVPEVHTTYVVLAPSDQVFERLAFAVPKDRAPRVLKVGGPTRHESVLNGLQAMDTILAPKDWVMVHDAARPGLTSMAISTFIQAVSTDDVGGLVAMPLADTLKREDAAHPVPRVKLTVDRAGLWQAQTPQMFRYDILCRSLRRALEHGLVVTDEASAIEAQGLAPRLVRGNWRNFKVTYPDDLELAAMMLREQGQ